MRRILVVPSSLCDELAPLTGRAAFEVRTSETIDEALAATAAWPPQLIVFGDELSDGTPQSFCARVRADQRLGGTRLLLLSGFLPGDEVGAEVLLAEVDAHLVRPVREEVLLRTVGVLLDIQLRRAERLPLELLARVEIEATLERARASMMANILGISETGVELECEDKLEPGEVITVSFALPDTGARLQVRCMVLASDELQLHYRCEFLDSTPEEKIAIRQFVREQLGPPEAAAE